MKVRRRMPSPAMVVAIVALVAALTGSAVALKGKNSVKSNDIAPSAVKGKDIRKQSVKASDLDLVKVDGEAGPQTTTSGPATDLGGPSVTVNVPETGLIALYARGTGHVAGGGKDAVAQIHLSAPKLLSGNPRVLEFNGSEPQLRITTPGPGEIDGTPRLTRGGWLVFPADKGKYRFSLRYSVAGGGTGVFSNTGLWAGVIG